MMLWSAIAIALHCWRHGHDWREQHASPCARVTACAWCGQFRGIRRDFDTCPPRWKVQPQPERPDLTDLANLYHGTCPKCGEWKFIGHGPLCSDCYLRGDGQC